MISFQKIVRFLKNEEGDTNVVPILIILIVVAAAAILFGPYVKALFE